RRGPTDRPRRTRLSPSGLALCELRSSRSARTGRRRRARPPSRRVLPPPAARPQDGDGAGAPDAAAGAPAGDPAGAADGALERVGPNVQPAPDVEEEEQAARSPATSN